MPKWASLVPKWTSLSTKMGIDEATAKAVLARTPVGRFGKPEEIATVVLFLASDDSTFMLGEEILVNGGWATL